VWIIPVESGEVYSGVAQARPVSATECRIDGVKRNTP